MRVSTKMTLGLSATCLVIAGLHGIMQLRQESQDLRKAVEKEIRLLGTSVKVAVENALRDRQFEDIQQTLDSLEVIDPTVDFLIFDRQKNLKAQSPGSALAGFPEQAGFETIATGRPVLRFDEGAGRGRVVLGLPLANQDGSPAGGLVLIRSLDELRRDLIDTRRGIVLSVILLVLATTALQFFLGIVYVTRPLTVMAKAMRKLRSGDLTAGLASSRHDEVGALAGEFDSLVADLRSARERIAREVESRNSLERGLQQVDKLVTIGQLSAGLAHEIGSPLQIMNGRARALLTRPHSPEDVRKNAEILADQTDRIARIVEQLLRFSRRRAVNLSETDLRRPVEAVLDLVDFSARRLGVSLELRCEERMPPAVLDVDQIQQVILNLLKNALEATPPGGKIAISIQRSVLEPREKGTRVPAARLVVEDSGCGMSPDVLDKLFEPFFTTRAAQGGTGLGLAVVKAIVLQHGGSVSAASTPERGSRFTVDLPLRRPEWEEKEQGEVA
ncbi:MAG: sensor histidine kinase [Acidobacteria bacterium]|nr:MAG: sensor histidine kinase [Acidobacteriota bacterium]